MVYVPPEYPSDIPEFAEVWPPVDDVNWMYTSAWDALVKELRAIMTELGTLPKGAHADVKTRLNVQQHKIADDDGDSYEDVEKTADVDEAVTYLKNVLVRKFHDDGILDLPKQSFISAYLNTLQENIAYDTHTKVLLNAEITDVQNEFDPVTHRFTAKKAGAHAIVGMVEWVCETANKLHCVEIRKNGAAITFQYYHAAFADRMACPTHAIVLLAANDYIELYAYHVDVGTTPNVQNDATKTYLQITKVA